MKFLLALVLAFGAASATQPWTPGKEYVFEYKTRTMTGIPYLKNQVSGVGLRANVVVQANSPSELLIKMTEVSMAKVENGIFSSSPLSWRKELDLQYSPIESRQGLSTPFKVVLEDGKVREVEVSKEEPAWVTNIKRALASKLSLNLSKIQHQSILASENKISQEPEQMLYVENEPGVTGNCRTYYTIVPLPEYIAQSHEYDLHQEIKQMNEARPAFVVTKTKDFTSCSEKPSYIHSSTVDMNEEGSSPADAQHKSFSSRTAIHRYLIRGEPMHKFVIERVWAEGEFVVRPFATNTESILINSNQTLVLKKEQSIRSPLSVPSSTVRKSLVFELVPNNEEQQRQQEQQQKYWGREEHSQNEFEPEMDEEDQYREQVGREYSPKRFQRMDSNSEEYPKLTKAPYMKYLSGKQVPVPEVKDQIRKMVDQVDREIESYSELSKKDLAYTVLRIAEALTVLDLEDMKEVYRQTLSEEQSNKMSLQTKKQVLLDALVMCGTNPAIVLVKELIVKKEVKGEQAAQLLLSLPVSVKTPTPELIRELVDLVRHAKQSNGYEQVWMTGLLAVSNLLNRACINPLARRHNFAISPFTERPYCTYQDAEILLPLLRKMLHQTSQPEKLTVILQAIGNLGSHQTLELLRPYIQGKITSDKQIRSKAMLVLHRYVQTCSRSQKMKVQALLKPIFASPVEENEVRMSAFVALLSTRPGEAFFTEAATGTWFEPSQQVGQFVYSTLAAMANCTYPGRQSQNMTRKAALALPLAKEFNLGVQYSQYVLSSHIIPERQIGSLFQWAHFGSKHSLVPEQTWFSLRNFLGGFDVPVLEASVQSQGIQNLINRFLGPQERNKLSSGLNIHTRKDFPIQGSLWIKGMGQMERVFTMETLRELAVEGVVEFTTHKEMTINYQKTIPLEDVVMIFPMGSGIPVSVTRKTPLFISIRGRIELHMEEPQMSFRKNIFPKDVKLSLDVKPILSLTRKIEAGISCPLTKKVFKAGHKTNVLATLPGKVDLIYRNQELEIVAKRSNNLPSKVELLAIQSYPYTAHTQFYNFETQETKSIRVQSEFSEMKRTLGRKYFGLAMEFEGKLDQPFMDYSGLYNLIKPHTPLTLSQFALVPHTLREVNYNLNLDLSQSKTEEVRAKIIYESKDKKFSLHEMEEEERIQGIYYKNQESSSWNKIRSDSESFMGKPWESVEESYSKYPTKTIQGRRNAEMDEEYQQMQSGEKLSKSRSLHAEVTLEGSETRRYRASSILSFSPCMTKAKYSAMFEREPSSEIRSFKAVINGQIQFPRLPSERSQILEAEKTAMGHLAIRFGADAEREITARLVLGQTQGWQEATRSSRVSKECERYEQAGAPYTAVCREAVRRARALNKIVLEVQSQSLPRELRNMTLQANDLIKAALYPYMSNKAMEIQNPENKIKLVAVQEPKTSARPYSVFNIFWYKPRENTFFQHIKASPLVEAILPICAEHSVVNNAFNNLMGQQFTPNCEVQRELITTFDNVTYKYPLTQCWHLVAKDCSKRIPIQVWAKQSASQGHKIVKLNAGEYSVELLSEKEVKINGEVRRLSVRSEEEQIRNEQGRTVLKMYRPKERKLIVTAPIHGVQIVYDGRDFQVKMSNMYRGQTCGLCGDMNGEKTAELKDPQGCIRNNWEQFGRSYAVGNCGSEQSGLSSLESSECMREYTVIPSQSYNQPGQEHQFSGSSSGLRYHNKVISRNGNAEICFSVKPVPECKVGYKPTGHLTKEIGFHCVRRGRMSNEMAARARSGVLEELLNKSVDFSEYVSIPESCTPIAAY